MPVHIDFGKTVFHAPDSKSQQSGDNYGTMACSLILTKRNAPVQTFQIKAAPGQRVLFGRNAQNDIVLNSTLVSREHGWLQFDNGYWFLYEYCSVTNHIRVNGAPATRQTVGDGDYYITQLHDNDILRIDYTQGSHQDGLQFIFSKTHDKLRITSFLLTGKAQVTIGRDPACDLCLPHVSVSRVHAIMERRGNGFVIWDNRSTNGVLVNNEPLLGKKALSERDVITIVGIRLIFSAEALHVITSEYGVSLSVVNLSKEVGLGKKKKRLLNGINLRIQSGEFVAIVGTSGTGKSTLLNCLSGFMKPTDGQVYINSENVSACFDTIKSSIGFVPQQDIVFDVLSLRRMLEYAARQRMPADTSQMERQERIRRVLETLELTAHADTRIKNLSGGQRKRCSIAVELLADPGLFFLDEPTSGLDPGTERSLMKALYTLSRQGKTIIMVTHTPLYLELCDKIIVLGHGGQLCSCLNQKETLAYFGIDSLVDIYDTVAKNTSYWVEKWTQQKPWHADAKTPARRKRKGGVPIFRQFAILTQRYAELISCSRSRLLALIIQSPLIAAVVALVSSEGLFHEHEATKAILFTLAVAAIWIGMLNAVPEICKERAVLRRELMAGMSKTAYLASKLVMLSIMYALQSILLVGTFCACTSVPEASIIFTPLVEMILTLFVIMFTAGCMGLAISSLVSGIDIANSIVPYLMVPQMVFSGFLFDLSGNFLWLLKYPIIAYWGVNALCASADICALPMTPILTSLGLEIPKTPIITEFEFTAASLLTSWGALGIILVVSLFICTSGVYTTGKRLR